MQAPPLRLRLLEPSVGVVSGGTRVVLHGAGFRPLPHSLIVRFRVDLQDPEDSDANSNASSVLHVDTSDQLSWTSRHPISNTVDVSGHFLLETQLECVLPSFERQAKRAIAARTSLAASSASVHNAPQLVPLSVEVILNGGEQRSNALSFKLHQPLEIRRVSPQSVLMASPAVTATATLNILKLPVPVVSRTTTRGEQRPLLEVLEELSVLPVFVRVRQASERTGAVSEQTREGRWKLSSLGVYEVDFDAATMGFGAASVEITLNRVDFFRCKSDAPPEGHGYRVHRDMSLRAVEPACVSVTSGQVTEVKLLGDGFVDTGDIVVALMQKELPGRTSKAEEGDAATSMVKDVQVAQLNATYYGKNEVRCTVPANLPFGCTSFRVSLNGGRQFGQARVVGLLHRGRVLEGISPASSSLAGGATVTIRHSCLPLEDVDAFYQLQRLVPARRIRVRFQPANCSLDDSGGLVKVVTAEASSETPGVLVCKTPNFMENIKALNGMKTSESEGDSNASYMWRFKVAVALGGEVFQDALPFSFYLPPVIRSLTQHHGPSTGETCVKLWMKHKVPPQLKLLVRFSTLDFTTNMIVEGCAGRSIGTPGSPKFLGSVPQSNNDEDPDSFISCQTPLWVENSKDSTCEVPHLTVVQVSYDAGVTFFPEMDPPTQPNPLAKDFSYLCFLFYPPPLVRSAVPMSADILGGSYIRLQGEQIVDHGAQPSVIFESPTMSRKVAAFVEKGELRCCAPPFNVGLARVFVSLNGEQYTLCELHDPESNTPLDFIFYSSPTVTQISPLCASVRHASELKIFGTNLIETDRIKVRVSFPASTHGSGRRLVFKDVPGAARDGVITATTPTFPDDYANQTAHIDVALNGADFSGTSVPLRYFTQYGITRVDPTLGAFEVPVTLTVFLAPVIVTDKMHLRLRLEATAKPDTSEQEQVETVYGPVEARNWTASSVDFMMPPLSSLVASLTGLTRAHLDVSFDGVYFHAVGDLRDHYRVYNMPQLTSLTPLFGVADRETKVVAHAVHMNPGDVVKVMLFLESTDGSKTKGNDRRVAARAALVPVTTVLAEVHVQRQHLSWMCPSLGQLRASLERQFLPLVAAASGMSNDVSDGQIQAGMLLSERVLMQISVVDGQPTSLPFVFRYYRTPTLVAMNPHVGYVCSGSVISFEFVERIATPTVDFRFGDSLPSRGRIRDERFVECLSPELSVGSHNISISFNEQHYELAMLIERLVERPRNDEFVSSSAATFHAFPLPVFRLPPPGRERVYAFGPTSGGTVVVIKGRGFVPDTNMYVRFASQFDDAFDGEREMIVSANVVDHETIRCTSPPSARLGRAILHVSYNLQQFSDSMCVFEYHAPTRCVARGTLCGPISGQTPLKLLVQDTEGLPSLSQLLECVVRFESAKPQASPRHVLDIDAQFDPETWILSCITPAWPSNELVGLQVSLSRGDGELFADTGIKFLFYDPPEGVIKIEPAAGPVAGGTEVLVWCGSIVETGEITVSIQLSSAQTSKPRPAILVRGEIVGETVRFVAPSVDAPCTAVLSISLNGINYTSAQNPLHFTYYIEPTLRRITPGWTASEGVNETLVIEGEHLRHFGCNLLVRFSLQDDKPVESMDLVVDAQFVSRGGGALQCVFPAAPPGFYELEVSLNGQQFSRSLYVSKTFGNWSGTACTALLPFRHFASPFSLATATGPAAGGSTVVLFLGGKLLKLLARETKCQVQFTPNRAVERSARFPLSVPSGSASLIKVSTTVTTDTICMNGEIDHVNARVTCRAPLLRVACISHVDLLLPGASSACQLFGVRPSDREKYYSYESPSITTIAPSCGPTSGGTQLVIEGVNILDTAQIFVRFRSSLNEREFVLVPARYSRVSPSGSASSSPLIICTTPPVEFVEKTTSSSLDSVAPSTALVPCQAQPSPRMRDGATAGKVRTQTFQMLAEQSLKVQRAGLAHETIESKLTGLGTLRMTRSSAKTTPRGNLDATECGATVLVDFTLNAGEQFIAHSVRFHYYQEIDAHQVKWSPRHLPIQCLSGRQASDSRLLTVTMPKTLRLTESPERVCFRFDGVDANQILPTRRRPTLGTPGMASNSDATTGSSSCVAAKVLSANEAACLVPEFSSPGAVQVLFSPNAQQFVWLGELLFHPAMTIKEEYYHATFRFCSNVAGSPFALQCSPSTVLQYLAPEDTTTADKQHAQLQNLGLRKRSVALEQARAKMPKTSRELKSQTASTIQEDEAVSRSDQEEEDMVPTAATNDEVDEAQAIELGNETCDVTQLALGTWQKRSFHLTQVILVPANAKLLKRVTMTATRVDTQSEAGKVVSDDAGCGAFDMSNWSEQVLLSAALPSSCGYASYSTVFEPFSLRDGKKPGTSGSTLKTQLVLTQLPTIGKLHVTVIGPCAAPFRVLIVDGDGNEVNASAVAYSEPEVHNNSRTSFAAVDASVLLDSVCLGCYVCVRFGAIDHETLSASAHDEANIQILISDTDGVQLCLCGSPVESAVWIVSRFAVLPVDPVSVSTSPSRAIEAVDIVVEDPVVSGSAALKDVLAKLALSPKPVDVERSQAYAVPVTFEFTSADSTRSLAATSCARLVLSASDKLQMLATPSQIKHGPAVTLECAMPPLAFSGLATLVIRCGGVIFSNCVTVHCYDPRSWKVSALCPPCGQLPSLQDLQDSHESCTLRLKGEHFVENGKIMVRVADKDRYFTVPGKLDQVHVLNVRLAAIKNLRCLLQPLGLVPQAPTVGAASSPHKRDDKYLNAIVGGTTSGGSIVALVSTWSTFTFTVRIECGEQRLVASCREASVFAALTSGSALSWEEEFEVRIASDRHAPLLLTAELSEPSLPKPLELAQAWVPLNGIQEGSSEIQRYTAKFDEHFKRGNYGGSDATPANDGVATEVDLLLQLSPLILDPDYIVAQVPYPLLLELSPQTLDVQVSSGDGVYSVPRAFVVYQAPFVAHTSPSVLPRSAGGDVSVTGTGFINSGRVCVRLFAFKKNRFKNDDEEQRALATINSVKRFQRTASTNDGFYPYFARDVEGVFVSDSSLKFRMPPFLTSFNVYYSVSFDGRAFTEVSHVSSVIMFSISAVTPKGGPISGNTYTTLHGTNLDACLSRHSRLTPLVRVTWKRGARDLEHVTVPAEFYPHEDAVYFYSPQSKFGLYSVAVNVELALVAGADSSPRFGRDEVSFVMYKTPMIKSVAPLTALVSGLSTTEILVQGFDEKAVSSMRLAPKLRFKRRGQMQVSDAQLVSESRFECIVPRFNVTNATATELPFSALTGLPPVQKLRAGGGNQGALSPRRSYGHAKLWTRTAGIFVALLGARNLRASKKNACNPFAVVYAGKTQLKSTRKDGVFSPVWNELFDFEWSAGSEPSSLPSVRVVLENQLTADQSESLGHVELQFPVLDRLTQPFALRAWFPLRRIRGKYARQEHEDTAASMQQSSKPKKRAPVPVAAPVLSLGDVELAIAFVPPVAPPKKLKKALRSSIISVLSTQSQPGKQVPGPGRRESGQVVFASKKERLLRAFRQRGAPVSLVPTELAVELALNGQDFWSVAPSTCYSVLTPLVVDVEPKFICVAGGSTLYVSGTNFVNTGCLRVGFVVLNEDDMTRSERTVVVEAKYRSSTSLVCTTPSLLDWATDTSYVNVYVSLNGTDFDSIALPKQLVKLSQAAVLVSNRCPSTTTDERIEGSDGTESEEPPRKSPRQTAESDSTITFVNDEYVVDYKKVLSLSRTKPTQRLASPLSHGNLLLVPQLGVYFTPKITCVRPTNGVYTSELTIEGTNFKETGIAVARFTAQGVESEVRTAKLLVVSSTRMECDVPDFPKGILVRVAVAMNGVEFVPCPGELRVFQSPRLTQLFPNWVSANTTLELELRGVNLAATVTSMDDKRAQQDTASVQVSFSGSRGRKTVRGVCEDGKVRCAIPRELVQLSTPASRDKTTSTRNCSILVDIWLGGKHNAFTGSPLPLHVYREIPTVHLVSPMDGPVYGGFAIVVEGRGFLDTDQIVVRFQLYTEQHDATSRPEDESSRALEKRQGDNGKDGGVETRVETSRAVTEPIVPSYVDVAAKFVSAERVLCPAPSFPHEGVYKVLVALNNVEFSHVSDGSWFLAWQNWQKRKRLLSHALFSRATAMDEAASAAAIAGAAAASAALGEKDIDRLRRKSSFMLPKIKSALAGAAPVESSSTSKAKGIESISEDSLASVETEEMLVKDPRLLQWHPTSSVEARVSGRPLLSLLEYLCAVRETQQFICRRVRVAFRLKSTTGQDSTDALPALRFTLFVEAMRLIFPNALMRELEELWQAADHRPDGTMTIKQLLRRLLRYAASDERSKSPEPGPTHYEPRYSVVSSRETAAIILPPVVQPEHVVDPPSALFIDYEAAVQAVKPRPPRPVFRKRKFNTSWCNPVVEGASEPTPPSPRPLSHVNRARPSPRFRLDEDAASVRPSEAAAALTDDATMTKSEGDVDNASRTQDQVQATSDSRVDAPQPGESGKEDAVRTSRALPITPQKLRTRAATPAVSSAPTNSLLPRQTNLSGPNPFYNDIAPLYAKFLNSTEVKRFLKQ